jgi:protocatechuate 3,4-dioxygenase, alpha subunit
MTPARTPSQTIGPFFAVAIPRPGEEYVVPADTAGAFWIRGIVTDGDGQPVPDALIETWQPAGAPGSPAPSRSVGRSATDAEGRFAIHTVKPRAISWERAGSAPHLDVAVFARGLLRHLVTRAYFGDEIDANAADSVLLSIDEADRATLVATRTGDGYRFDIRLQGDGETVFFEL